MCQQHLPYLVKIVSIYFVKKHAGDCYMFIDKFKTMLDVKATNAASFLSKLREGFPLRCTQYVSPAALFRAEEDTVPNGNSWCLHILYS